MEQKFSPFQGAVKQQLGEMLFTIIALQYQLEEANKQITELKKD